MLRRIVRRWRSRGRPAPWQPPPATTWRRELQDARVDAGTWIARRQEAGRLYVDVPGGGLERLHERHAPLVSATVAAAERILRHEFDLLGSGPFTPRDPDRPARPDGYAPIDWALDPVSRLRFPCGFRLAEWNFDRMRPGLADIKLPWELSRCQHWAPLGQAFRLTGDARYALEIANELRDFVEANPVGVGVNWTCTMDVGLRAANWAIGLELVRECRSVPESFWREAHEALFDHGVFIERNLEDKYGVTSNHFLSNVVGLFFLSAVFGDLPRGRMWDAQCRAWLAREMDVQVSRDGSDFESSVPYHRLVTELMLASARLADCQGRPMPPEWLRRLRTMVDFLAAVLRPDGLLPQVGDADDGRLHVLTAYGSWKPQDPRHIFGPAACLFREAPWMIVAGEDAGEWEATWWGFDPLRAPTPDTLPRDGVRHFPDAGITVMRADGDYVLVTNGPVGTAGIGNHKHNDLLGFEYHCGGTAVVVDRGSYVYTPDPDARNEFRCTRAHNTVIVDDEEQNELRPQPMWLFRMFEQARPEHLGAADLDGHMESRGRHHGYTRLPGHVVHERTFTYTRGDRSLTLVDGLNGSGAHRVQWRFHFAPGVDVAPCGGGRFTVRAGERTLAFVAPPDLAFGLAPSSYSPSYGVRVGCVALQFDAEVTLDRPATYTFRFAPTS